MSKHDHTEPCEHKNLSWCKKCNVVYCKDCDKEWEWEQVNAYPSYPLVVVTERR